MSKGFFFGGKGSFITFDRTSINPTNTMQKPQIKFRHEKSVRFAPRLSLIGFGEPVEFCVFDKTDARRRLEEFYQKQAGKLSLLKQEIKTVLGEEDQKPSMFRRLNCNMYEYNGAEIKDNLVEQVYDSIWTIYDCVNAPISIVVSIPKVLEIKITNAFHDEVGYQNDTRTPNMSTLEHTMGVTYFLTKN